MSKEKIIYQLMLDKSEYRDSSEITNWAFNPYGQAFDIDDTERKRAIERLRSLLPKECFSIEGETITYHGSTKACAEDYSDQLIAHAYDVLFSGFSRSVMSSWQALNTLYFMDDLFFVGYDRTNPVTLPNLLAFLEREHFVETTFIFGSITLVED